MKYTALLPILLSCVFVGLADSLRAETIMLECEQFANRGGWSVDSQFIDEMGSSYLLAHGLGKPVADATTTFEVKTGGRYNVFVRTKNWTAKWEAKAKGEGEGEEKDSAGRFYLIVNGEKLPTLLGVQGKGEWLWAKVDDVTLKEGTNTVALHDVSGFDGRCDAVCFTTEPNPLSSVAAAKEDQTSTSDLVVVGGGIAGVCTAISAARLGLKVALVQDRPVLGGANSSEVRVHLGGYQNLGPYPRLGDVVSEIGPAKGGNAQPASQYEDDRKLAAVKAEKNISLFLNTRVVAAERPIRPISPICPNTNRIAAVVGRDVVTGARTRFEAPLFVDCTGDGCVGYLAGADYRLGRESKAETGEEMAPEKADKMTMGASCQWYAEKVRSKNEEVRSAVFPYEPWMIKFNEQNCEYNMRGDWDWETGMNRDQLMDFETVRDYAMLVVYSNWSYIKNFGARKAAFADAELSWLAYVAGKRETRRLLGDHILTQQDVFEERPYPDGTCCTTWAIDLHYPMPANKRNYEGEPFRSICTHNSHYAYPIPYRCFYSRNVPNLFMAGRDISVTHVALGTTRVMRTHGMMGEVVGMAASICKKYGCDPRGVYAEHLDELKALMTKGVGLGKPQPPQDYNEGALKFKPSACECIDGVYPHLAMSNDEGECGTGAVVPWAGSLWVVTYGPHQPVGSTDKLYQIAPDLKRVTRKESVGGTPADRMIHRETNQLLIGPYVIDAKGKVRVVPPKKMPGRLTGAGRHLVDPANLVSVATMDNGLYTLDMHTLAVKTLLRDHNGVDGKVWGRPHRKDFPFPPDWNEASDNLLPGSHTKGMCTGFGRVQLSNNGEYHPEAKTNPWIPAGVLGDCASDGTDQRVIRRCQFTEITTADGIYGNEHPEKNPIWALGWDAKSVILAVTTNGTDWTYYRLPKGSHCYDGAHGWNTEWPRIREAGLGDGNLLATMHGTFWRFPKDFSPAQPDGIRPISTYLKVIGDFCWWADAPNGGSIVFGCDDHAKSEFLGKRKLKADQPKIARSTSNLWFVKPDDLKTFGPPTGEGWVWCNEDVKEGDVSDPYLWAGYAEREFSFTDAAGRPVPYEFVHAGDWVRVKALADAKGVKAHFVYGLPKPDQLPALDARQPYIDVTDDNGKVFRLPNVNGDTKVLCREVATERDLLYVGGVFYELPAENAGGFACLRPIALADAPVKTIAVDRGLIVVNGKRMVLDSLWKNGTAPTAYWLWRMYFRPVESSNSKGCR